MNRMVRPVQFAFEPDVVSIFLRAVVGAAGAITLDTKNSKGVCGFSRNTVAITGNTTSGSTSVTSVSTFAYVYPGMAVTGPALQAGTTIASVNGPAGTLTLSQTASSTLTGTALSASGGQYTITFGSQLSPARLDTYVKLLNLNFYQAEFGNLGTASSASGAPAAPIWFLVKNNVSISGLANIVIQMGTGAGTSFLAVDPDANSDIRAQIQLCRSTAI